MGSSSAVTVGVLNALHQFKGESVPARQLAEEACKIEVDILKKPIGYQDQYVVAFGGLNLIQFSKEIIIISLTTNLEDYLMLFNTGITRKAEKVLSKMKLNKKILDKNTELVVRGCNARYEPMKFGNYLSEYWMLKKALNKETTNKFIDKMYIKAIMAGALGGKIVGAGGGGFLLLVVPPEKKEAVREALGLRELPFNLSRDGSKVIFNIRK